MPYLRAQATILRAVGPSFTPPRPTSPRKRTPAAASSWKSCSSMPGSITGAPAWTFTPLARKFENVRCAAIASAFSPTMSRGRPGVCTSPAETMVVTPPCRQESIQPSWFCRGVQSPATGWTWLSIRPGASVTPWASIVVVAPERSRSAARPIAVMRPSIARIASASKIGLAMSPLSIRPMFLIASLAGAPEAAGSSWAMLSPKTLEGYRRIHSLANSRARRARLASGREPSAKRPCGRRAAPLMATRTPGASVSRMNSP